MGSTDAGNEERKGEAGSPVELSAQELQEIQTAISPDAAPDGSVLRAVQVLMEHKGPMPSEQWLTTVEGLEPGTTKSIVEDFLIERQHQRDMQTDALQIDKENAEGFRKYQSLQLLAAWSVVVLLGAAGIVLIALGHSIGGLIMLVTELAVLAGVFVGRQVIQSRSPDD